MSPDMSQYLDIFLDEGRQQLTILESNILELERGERSTEILVVIFRAAHTLKGSSRAMGFLAIGDLTHEMENVLDDLRNDKFPITTEVIDALFSCLDALTSLMDSIASMGEDIDTQNKDIPALVLRMTTMRARTRAGKEPPAAIGLEASPKTTPTFKLAEYELACIADAKEANLNVYLIDIELDPDCVLKSVRVFMALGALEPLGALIASNPSEDSLDAEDFESAFQLVFATAEPADAIEKILTNISEVRSVAAVVWPEAPADRPPAEVENSAAPTPTAEIALPAVEPEPAAIPELQPILAEAKEEAPPAKKAPAPAHAQTIRVDVERLDAMLNLVGELVIGRTQIERLGANLHRDYPHDPQIMQLLESTHHISRVSAELQDEIMKTRLLPIDGVFQRMPRMVRDLAQKTGKDLDLDIFGGDTELDRSVLEILGDPLIHLLRNSVDHGVESPDERLASGKDAKGRVTLSARHEENHIVIEITDDGRGIDPVKVKNAAIRKGIINQAAADALSDRDALHLIFASGFSTAETISDISGRGVGMDIVKSNLEKISGRIVIDSEVGKGSCFTIHLPLTLAIVRALLVSVDGGTYVLPLGGVVEMLHLGGDEGVTIRSIRRQGAIVLRGRTIPLANLSDVLNGDPRASEATRIREDAYVVIVGWADQQIGLCVDRLIGEQEVVIKSLGKLLGDMRGLSGATILADGRVALIIDPARAIESLREMSSAEETVVRC